MIASATGKSQSPEPRADRSQPGELAIDRVGMVGLGHMGHAFALNLIEDGYQVVVGEVLALLRKGGIDSHLAFDVLINSLFESRVHKGYGGKIVDGRYSPPGMAVPA